MKALTKWHEAILLLFLSCNAWTQTSIAYDYDGSGNRKDKHVILLKSGRVSLNSDSLQITDQPSKKEIKEIHEDQLGKMNIKIYPNPTLGILNVEIQGFNDQSPILFTLYDLSGKALFKIENHNDQLLLDLSPYSKGIYILKIQSGIETRDWKIIKE